MKYHLQELHSVLLELPEEKRCNLQVKVHHDFIPATLSGFGERIFCGTYLRNRAAEDGVQFIASGKGKYLYDELNKHFETQFKYAKMIRFESEEYIEEDGVLAYLIKP